MKKTVRRLTVHRETLSRLDANDLEQPAGGLLQLNDTVYRTEPVPINDTVYHPVHSDACSAGCPVWA
jgi:hypothetical protein